VKECERMQGKNWIHRIFLSMIRSS